MRHITILLLLSFSILSVNGQNLLLNPGFENSSSWIIPKYWGGELKIVSPGHTGKSCEELKSTLHGKDYFGRCYQLPVIEPAWGRLFTYTMEAKGQGELLLGILLYTKGDDGKIKTDIIYAKPLTLKDQEWQKAEMDILVTPSRFVRFVPMVEVRGQGAVACLDDGKLTATPEPGVTLTVSPAHLITETGQPSPEISFQLLKDGQPLSGVPLKVLNNIQLQDAVTGKDGKFAVKPDNKATHIMVSAVKSGVANEVFIDRMAPDAWKATDNIAKSIKLKKPLSILYLGDSLSDFQRGHNYIDKVDFWLNRYNPGKAGFRNAGVRGDYIVRVQKRLIDGNSYQQEKYDHLFDREYDYVFIFLGHNDTRCTSDKDYREPLVKPSAQENAYRRVIHEIRKHSKARIVLVSPTSSNFDICRQNADKLKAQNKPHTLFGQPGQLETFKAVLEKLVKEENLLYLDVYTPTRNASGKASLFSATDGVHLTEEGNRFLTDLFLQFLKEQN